MATVSDLTEETLRAEIRSLGREGITRLEMQAQIHALESVVRLFVTRFPGAGDRPVDLDTDTMPELDNETQKLIFGVFWEETIERLGLPPDSPL